MKTNRIVGRECASCCDAYQSWRYPSLHAETAVSLTTLENPRPYLDTVTVPSLVEKNPIVAFLHMYSSRAAFLSAEEATGSPGIFEIMGFFGDRRLGISGSKTYSSWRSVVLRREVG